MHARMLVFAMLMWPLSVSAQPLIRHISSLEAQALNSRYICVGRILKLETPSHINATVQVEQVIKGALMVGRMGLLVKGTPEQLEKWRESKAQLLIFDETTVDLGDPKLEMISSEGKFLWTADAIIRAMKRVTEENPGVYAIETASRGDISLAGSRQVRRGGEVLRLWVPADRNFERWCYETIAQSKNLWQRADAARDLVFFPSERAIATLKKLLSDPGTVEESPGKHRYVVRIHAWETLLHWNDTIPKPEEYRRAR